MNVTVLLTELGAFLNESSPQKASPFNPEAELRAMGVDAQHVEFIGSGGDSSAFFVRTREGKELVYKKMKRQWASEDDPEIETDYKVLVSTVATLNILGDLARDEDGIHVVEPLQWDEHLNAYLSSRVRGIDFGRLLLNPKFDPQAKLVLLQLFHAEFLAFSHRILKDHRLEILESFDGPIVYDDLYPGLSGDAVPGLPMIVAKIRGTQEMFVVNFQPEHVLIKIDGGRITFNIFDLE